MELILPGKLRESFREQVTHDQRRIQKEEKAGSRGHFSLRSNPLYRGLGDGVQGHLRAP